MKKILFALLMLFAVNASAQFTYVQMYHSLWGLDGFDLDNHSKT